MDGVRYTLTIVIGIFELEGAVADRDDLLKQRDAGGGNDPGLNAVQQHRIEELERQLAAAIDVQKSDVGTKMEVEGDSQQRRIDGLQQQVDGLTKMNGEQQQSLDDMGTFLADVDKRTGTSAADIEDKILTLRDSLTNEQAVSKARATTISNYETQLRKKDEKLANKQSALETAQSGIQRLKAKLFRETLK